MITNILVALFNVCLKLLAAFCAWALAGWLQAPEWAMIGLIVMSIQSTFLTVNQS